MITYKSQTGVASLGLKLAQESLRAVKVAEKCKKGLKNDPLLDKLSKYD